MKTNRWQRAQAARDGRGIGRWPVVVTNEAETASRITQMMAVPKGNGHAGGRRRQRWEQRRQAGRHDGVLGVLHTGRA